MYVIGLQHHSISQSPEIETELDLPAAKRLATKEFGGGFNEHKIVILDANGVLVSSRRIDEKAWTDAE